MISTTSALARLYKSTPIGEAPEPGSFVRQAAAAPAQSFTETMTDVGKAALSSLGNAETTALNGMSGKADPHAVVEALAAAELALETAVSVRDKAVEAYQEILRMPV